MKIGIFLTNQQHLDADMMKALQGQITMLHAARDGGWDSLLAGQHYLNEGDNQQLSIVPYLARLMAESGEMTPGMGIFLLPLHNPVYVAETIASLDIISGGRFIFGVGLGYRDMEFDAFGVERKHRVRIFEESLALMRRLWSGEAVTYQGEGCKLDNVTLNLRPVQKPHPPIWIAANGERAVRRAARLGDSWFINPMDGFDLLTEQVAMYREELERIGKPWPNDFPLFREIYVGKDRQTALEKAGPWLVGKYGDYARWGITGDESEASIEELARGRFILGSPEECFEQLKPYHEQLGVNHFVLRTHWAGMPLNDAMASIQLISDELLPALRKL